MTKLWATTMAILLIFSAVSAQESTLPITWKWGKPTVGTEPVAYMGDIEYYSTAGDTTRIAWSQATADTVFTWNGYIPGTTIRARVQAEDAQGRRGPFSVWSEWFTLEGPWAPNQMAVINVGGQPVE